LDIPLIIPLISWIPVKDLPVSVNFMLTHLHFLFFSDEIKTEEYKQKEKVFPPSFYQIVTFLIKIPMHFR